MFSVFAAGEMAVVQTAKGNLRRFCAAKTADVSSSRMVPYKIQVPPYDPSVICTANDTAPDKGRQEMVRVDVGIDPHVGDSLLHCSSSSAILALR